jgi:hypothetical protein
MRLFQIVDDDHFIAEASKYGGLRRLYRCRIKPVCASTLQMDAYRASPILLEWATTITHKRALDQDRLPAPSCMLNTV